MERADPSTVAGQFPGDLGGGITDEEVTHPIHTDSDTQSGDGAATTFTIPHTLGAVPSSAIVVPTSADAAGDFHRSGMTDTNVEVTYAAAPADAVDNLEWDVVLIE